MAYTPLTVLNNYNGQSETFAGLKTVNYNPSEGITDTNVTYRLDCDPYGDNEIEFDDLAKAFFNDPKVSELTTLSLGAWEEEMFDGTPEKPIKTIIENADKLPKLRAFFSADVGQEMSEMTWLNQTSHTELLEAFPNLEILQVRGIGLTLENALRHSSLKHFTYETSSYNGEYEDCSIVKTLMTCSFPQLQHLEIWVNEKGGYDEMLSQQMFPNLEYLGVRNAEDLDDFVIDALPNSPQLATLKVLDLSGGTLTDKGGEALLDNPAIKNLELLDLHHHYLSDEMMEKLRGLGIKVNLQEQQVADEYDGEYYYYTMVSE